MKGTPLILFRSLVTPGAEFAVGSTIKFPDGEGVIRSLVKVEREDNGRVYVYGKYRPLEGGKTL